MNLNSIINMVIRQVMRRAVNFGVGAGIKAATRLGKNSRGGDSRGSTMPVPGSDRKRAAKQARLTQRGPWK